MARHKDAEWNLPDKLTDMNHLLLAALMDIRDELKLIRRLHERTIGCHNFTSMPAVIKRIDKRIAKKVKLP